MLELLKEQLKDYQSQYDTIQEECHKLWKDNKPWRETAKKAAGLSMLIKHCKEEIKKLS
mgnify:CR=1 FL=1